jgi:hypothetical protein
LASALARHGATDVILIGFGAQDPVVSAVDLARDVLAQGGIATVEALRVTHARIYSLICTDLGCCPPGGVPLEPGNSSVTADAELAGLTARPNRAAIADELRPDAGPGRAEFLAATEVAARRLLDLIDAARSASADPMNWIGSSDGQTLLKSATAAVDDSLAAARSGQRLDHDQAAWLSVLLKVPGVLDYALQQTSGDRWQIGMWADLVRRANTRLLASPASLLAVCALRAGNGALAGAAVAAALSAEPDNRLARYLHLIVAAGIAPHEIAAILARTDSFPDRRPDLG